MKGTKGQYYEYHKSKTHDTINCSVLKRETDENKLKGNLIEVARSLHAKFDAENARDTTKECDKPHEILTIKSKRRRREECNRVENLTQSMQGLMFSAKDPRPIG